MPKFVTNVRIDVQENERANLHVTECGTVQTYETTRDEAEQLASLCASRAGIGYGIYKDGTCVAACVPFDTSYVPPTQTVYLVLHPVYETYAAYFTRAEAERARVQECKDARDAYAEAEYVTQYERDNAQAFYVSKTDVAAIDVPLNVRLQGKDAVLEYLNGGM